MNRISILLVAVVALAPPAYSQELGFVRDVFIRINRERVQNRLKPCTYNKILENAAQAHADWMARSKKMDHLQPLPQSFEEHRTGNHHPINRAINAGYIKWEDAYTLETRADGQIVHAKLDANEHVGEIIAAGWNAGPPVTQPETIVKGWMNSPGHRKEIVTVRYAEMGIGVACKPDGKDTFWCVVFGKPKE